MLSSLRQIAHDEDMNRRNFLVRSSAMLAASSLHAAEDARLTDCHVYLGRHPFRQLENEQAFLKQPVTEAWAGAFEGLLCRDVAAVNHQLAQHCKTNAALRPCGTINLALPDWQDDVKRCAEVHGMRVVRLHPNYHGYDLKSSALRDLLALAAKHRLLVQIVVQMEDERTQHPQVRVAPTDLQPLPAIMREIKESRVMILNANAAMVLRHLQDCPNVWLDFAMIEGVGGVENLLKTWSLERLVFGSFAPVFYWDAARLKMQESALDEAQTGAIQWRNASALLC
jgi:predicted TIM-barrel fold metal-dependent hydrolase